MSAWTRRGKMEDKNNNQPTTVCLMCDAKEGDEMACKKWIQLLLFSYYEFNIFSIVKLRTIMPCAQSSRTSVTPPTSYWCILDSWFEYLSFPSLAPPLLLPCSPDSFQYIHWLLSQILIVPPPTSPLFIPEALWTDSGTPTYSIG